MSKQTFTAKGVALGMVVGVVSSLAMVLVAMPIVSLAETSLSEANEEAKAGENVIVDPLHIELRGEIRSYPQADGGDIMTCSGGIYAYQRLTEEQSLLELRAEKVVIFYSQKDLPRLLSSSSGDKTPADSNEKQLIVSQPLGMYLEGDVVLQIGKLQFDDVGSAIDNKITAKKLYYDFTNKSALVLDGVLRIVMPDEAVPIYVRAQRIRQWSQSHYTAEKVKLSNDEFHLPHVWLGMDEIDIIIPGARKEGDENEAPDEGRFEMKNITINLEEQPIFWWPRAIAATTKKHLPIQALHTSVSSERGTSVESEWSLAWLLGVKEPSGVDSVLLVDEYSKRGPGGGVEVDYTSEKNYGHLRSYIINDGGEDRLGRFDARKDVPVDNDLRGRARWQHRQYLPYDWEGTFEVSYISDRNFLESWRQREFNTDKGQETVVYFKQQRDNWAFDFLNKFHLNNYDYTLTELPRAGLYAGGVDLFDGLLTYQHDGYIARLRERAGERKVAGLSGKLEDSVLPMIIDQDDFGFGISRNELALPLHIGGVNLVPTVIGTYIYNDMGDENSNVQGAAGIRAGTQFWHVDNSAKSQLWDIDRIRHIVRPEVSAFWVDSDIKDVVHQDVFNFAINQRWQTKRGPEGEKYSVDFLRIDTSLTLVTKDVDDVMVPGKFFFSRPEKQLDFAPIVNYDLVNLGLASREIINQNLSDHADVSWEWAPSQNTAFTGQINYNIRDAVISQADGAVAVQRSPRSRYYVGYRYLRNGDISIEKALPNIIQKENANFITGGLSYKLNRKFTVALAHQYDIGQAADSYTRATLIQKFPHWYGAFSIGFDPTRSGVSFMVSFWPEGFDKVALGSRRFSRLTP